MVDSNLKFYHNYKPSSVEWLGDVPAHWEMRRTKSLLEERSQKGFPNEPLLAATQAKGVVRKEQYENRTVLALKDLHLLKLVYPGDFVISLRSFQGGIEYARDRGIISPAYTILYPENPDIHGYLTWLFKSKPYIENLTLQVTGIRQGQNIDYGRLSVSKIPLPPLPEQTAIVRYLDHADERIRRYISGKQKLIRLLEEEKQAVIHRAVTRGLDPNVRLKPSGVEGLGDVPVHWEVVALGYLATKFGSGVTPRGGATVYQETGIPFLRSQNIHFDGLHLEDVARITPRLHQTLSNAHVKPGDVLLNITGASIGRVCSVPDHFSEGNVSQHVCIIRPKKNRLLSGFLASFLSTAFMQREIRFEQNGASREGLTLHSIRNFKIVLPTISEQQRILAEIRAHTERLIAAVTTTRRQIELLQEYRTRLIADVVTGQLDVRAAAANLSDDPAMFEKMELVDDYAD